MFTPILLTFAGDDDATRGVAEEIALILREETLETELRPLQSISSLQGFGTVVLGAPITNGRWDAAARAFLVAHRDALIELPVAVFATAPPQLDPGALPGDRGELLAELAQMRWLHPIAADLFREASTPPAALNGARANGHGATPAQAFDLDEVRTWARWVARVLQPAMR